MYKLMQKQEGPFRVLPVVDGELYWKFSSQRQTETFDVCLSKHELGKRGLH